MISIGVDTSCYTTSVAAANESGIVFEKKTMLFVQQGNRGLRQSEGLYQHIRNLPALVAALMDSVGDEKVSCVCVSEKPTDNEGSYMPVFLAGLSLAESLASALRVPLYKTTHQRGHIRAAEIGNEALLMKEHFLGFHLSGGTTDLLEVRQSEGCIQTVSMIGSCGDLHVGQFVDRVGVALGLSFPAGKHLEALAINATDRSIKIPSSVNKLCCSFSGAETRAQQLVKEGVLPEDIAYSVYDCIARTIAKLVENAADSTGNKTFLFSGGVSSSVLLRELLRQRLPRMNLYFGRPAYCTDNACGVAEIGYEQYRLEHCG